MGDHDATLDSLVKGSLAAQTGEFPPQEFPMVFNLSCRYDC